MGRSRREVPHRGERHVALSSPLLPVPWSSKTRADQRAPIGIHILLFHSTLAMGSFSRSLFLSLLVLLGVEDFQRLFGGLSFLTI